METSIFSFSNNVFYTIKDKSILWATSNFSSANAFNSGAVFIFCGGIKD